MTERPTIDAGPGSVSRRQILKTGGALVVSAGAIGPLLAACGSSSSSTATPQQVATFGLANAFAGFNPATAVQVASLTITHHVFEPLVRYDQFTNTLSPWLLRAFPEKVGTNTYQAKLLTGLTFHDGTPVRPSDVVFTINYMKDPKNGAALGAFLNQVESVTASGDAIVFHLAHEFAAFNSLLSVVYVMPEKAFTTLGNDKFTARPVGSGPYSFAATQPGVSVVLDRYKTYKGRFKPKLDKITFNYVVDDSTREVELLSNQLSIIDTVPFRDFSTLGGRPGIKTGSTQGDRHLVLETNHTAGVMSDVRVRQALLYAMDRQAIIESVFLGKYAKIADSLLPQSNPFYVQPPTIYRPDPEKARQLLAEAGHPNGVDFELLLSTIPYITSVGQLLQQQWAKAGLRAKIHLTETEAGYGIVATKKYDTYLAYGVEYAFGTDPDIIYRIFDYGANRTGFYGSNSPQEQQYDKDVDQGQLAPTDATRKAAYARAQEIMSQTIMNNFPLIFVANLGAWQKPVTGYRPGPGDIPDLTATSIS
jgi:peptide/nickel transport system substrate-binding protein